MTLSRLGVCCATLLGSVAAAAQTTTPSAGDGDLQEITVTVRRVANVWPAGTFSTIATALRYDPLTDLQPRGIAEGQADVTVRGGLFENTGYKVGAVTIMDPQTGHYVAELPIDPAALSTPAIQLGVDNAIHGFNSNVATVSYDLAAVDDGGSLQLGVGNNNLDFETLRLATTRSTRSGSQLGFAGSVAHSAGDGTRPNGGHEFTRYNLHVQRLAASSQSDLLLAYQDKFYAWPGAYTGFASLPETDATKTRLLLLNHRRDLANGWWELGAYYRELDDDYDFDSRTQESGTPGSFQHLTRIAAVGVQGLLDTGRIDWRYGAQLTSDKLVRSTDLTAGNFNNRQYLKATLVPTVYRELRSGRMLRLRAGATVDASSRDSSAFSPLLGVNIESIRGDETTVLDIEFSNTAQLPGYTALNSPSAGLFGGNAALGREKAHQLTATVRRTTSVWRAQSSVFVREDRNQVDWTFADASPFSRQANAVDIDVYGFEVLYAHGWSSFEITAAYTFLDKDANYGASTVDASFYALNFARHRATLAMLYRVSAQLQFRFDNEYRVQEENSLRTSPDRTYLGSLSLTWQQRDGRGFGTSLTVDNLANSDYQPFPGTPSVGRQYSLSATYSW